MSDENSYRELFELAADAMFIVDQHRRIIEINQTAYTQLGYSKDEMLGRHVSDFIPSEFTALQNNRFSLVEDKGYLIYESALIHKDGSLLPVEICNRSIDWEGEPAFFGVVRDISERKRAELKLQRSEEKWRDLFENMTTGFALHDVICDEHGKVVDYRFLEVNRAFEKLTGLKASDIIGHTVLEALPGTETYWIEIFGRVALTGEPTSYENYSKELGRWYQVKVYCPKLGQFAVIISEVTERKLVEQSLQESERDLNQAQAIAHIGSWTQDSSGRITWSDECYRIFGYSRETFTPNRDELYKLVHPDDIQSLQAWNKVCASGEDPGPLEWRCIRPDGSIRCILGHGTLVRDEEGNASYMAGTVQDITERKQLETELRIAATAFESQESLIITDANTSILRVNNAFTESTGFTAEDLVGKTPRLFKSGRHDPEFYRNMWKSINRNGTWQGEIWDRRKNGDIYPKWLTISAVKNEDGQVTHYVGSHIDISDRKLAEEKIQHLAFYDHLTDLPNRLLLMDRLQQASASSSRRRRTSALLLIDLDNFKNLNDTLGHDIGDLLLKQVTQRLVLCMREGDTVARLGGDEFVVMLSDLSEHTIEAAEQTTIIGEKIRSSLSQPYQLGKHAYHCTASIGVTLFQGNDQSNDDLMKQADIALYQAKKSGRNLLRFFDPKMQTSIATRVRLESELHNALAQKQFQLYYQIQVNSANQPLGAEALIRWIHPERGVVSPNSFIPLAEETGLILSIGHWVLETACAQIKRWQQDISTRELAIAINVSAKQFHQVDFVEQVQTVVKQFDINPLCLKLELTESILLDNIAEAIETMNKLKEIGIQISLDDFGTGYSSLLYLKRLSPYQLKIDKSFVRDIATDPSDKAIVRTIIAMAQSLDMSVIAEGVETEEQRIFLLNNGCTQYQGYLFGKPAPIEQLDVRLAPACSM